MSDNKIPNPGEKSIAKYLREGMNKGICEYSVTTEKLPDGDIKMIIYPQNQDGETRDYRARGYCLFDLTKPSE